MRKISLSSIAAFSTCFILLFILETQAQTALTAFPKPFQLYCRDAQDSVVVAVTGAMSAAGAESVSVTPLYKNRIQTLRLAQRLQYSGDTVSFYYIPYPYMGIQRYSYNMLYHRDS